MSQSYSEFGENTTRLQQFKLDVPISRLQTRFNLVSQWVCGILNIGISEAPNYQE